MEICIDKVNKRYEYEYAISEDELSKLKCIKCTEDCGKSITVFMEAKFKEKLKSELMEIRHKSIDDIRVGLVCGHYSQINHDLDSLWYIAALIEAYHRKLSFNTVYTKGNGKILTLLKTFRKPAISENEYQNYYKQYKDVIDEVYKNK